MRLSNKQAEYLKRFAGHDCAIRIGLTGPFNKRAKLKDALVIEQLVKKGMIVVEEMWRDEPFSVRATPQGREIADVMRGLELLENPSL